MTILQVICILAVFHSYSNAYLVPDHFLSQRFHVKYRLPQTVGTKGAAVLYRNRFIISSRCVLELYCKANPKLDYGEDYYSVLEVDPNIDDKKLKKFYYKLVVKYHPDNKPNATPAEKETSNKQMMVINEAYSILRNSELRANYDRKRRFGMYGSAAGVKSGGSPKATAQSKSADKGGNKYSSRGNNGQTYASYSSSSAGSYSSSRRSRRPEEPDEPTESFVDLLGELWEDVTKNNGKALLQEALEFLEAQEVAAGRTPPTSSYREYRSSVGKAMSTSERLEVIRKDTTILKATLKTTKDHLLTVTNKLSVERFLLQSLSQPPPSSNSGSRPPIQSAEKLQERLRKMETVQSLESRIGIISEQIRNLQRNLDASLALQLKVSTKQKKEEKSGNQSTSSHSSGGSSSSSSSSSSFNTSRSYSGERPPRTASSMDETVESELQKLKELMKQQKK